MRRPPTSTLRSTPLLKPPLPPPSCNTHLATGSAVTPCCCCCCCYQGSPAPTPSTLCQHTAVQTDLTVARLVPVDAQESVLIGKAPVAVHDEGHVCWQRPAVTQQQRPRERPHAAQQHHAPAAAPAAAALCGGGAAAADARMACSSSNRLRNGMRGTLWVTPESSLAYSHRSAVIQRR